MALKRDGPGVRTEIEARAMLRKKLGVEIAPDVMFAIVLGRPALAAIATGARSRASRVPPVAGAVARLVSLGWLWGSGAAIGIASELMDAGRVPPRGDACGHEPSAGSDAAERSIERR